MGINYLTNKIIREFWKLCKLNDLIFQKGYFGSDIKDEAGDRLAKRLGQYCKLNIDYMAMQAWKKRDELED